jgi:hypothetical protein
MHNLFRVNKKCHKRVCPDLRFVVRADEKLTAFLELERAVCIHLLESENLEIKSLGAI